MNSNKLTVIGGLGMSMAFLNVEKTEAMARFNKGPYGPFDESYMSVDEFEFEDCFHTYDSSPLDG